MRGFVGKPPIYFGAPGNLVQLPWPLGGLQASYDRLTNDFVTGSGFHRVQKLSGGARTYTANWTMLHQSTFDLLNAYFIGANGPGPFVLIDPSRPNLLTPNQAAAGGLYNDATDFAVVADSNGIASADATNVFRKGGTRSIQWQSYFSNSSSFHGASATPLMVLSPGYSGWPGIPVIPGQFYTFSAVAMIDYMTGGSITAKLQWYDVFGNSLALSTGSVITLNSGAGWSTTFVTAQAPLNAAFVAPRFIGPGLMVSNGFFDANVNGWSAGATGSVAFDNTQAYAGAGSMKVTPNGTSASTLVTFTNIPVVAGQTYSIDLRLRPAVSHTTGVGLNINWLNAGGGTISTSVTNTNAPLTTTWNYLAGTDFVAPVGAVNAQLVFHIDGTPLATHIMNVDLVFMMPGSTSGVYIDLLQLEMDRVINDWAPGTGVRPVSILDLNEDIPIDAWFRQSPSAVLQEVS